MAAPRSARWGRGYAATTSTTRERSGDCLGSSARFREVLEAGDDSVTDLFEAPPQHELIEQGVQRIARGVVRFEPGVCRVGPPGFESDCEAVVVEHFAHAERFVIDDVGDASNRHEFDAALQHAARLTGERDIAMTNRADRFSCG